MKVFDFTHTIEKGMPVFPNDPAPCIQRVNFCSSDGFNGTQISLFSHTGTHIDAPNHVFEKGTTLENIDVSSFCGKAVVIDCTDVKAGGEIGFDKIEKMKHNVDEAEILIFRTGWDRFWGKDGYFQNYPVISNEIAQYVIQSGKKALGFDTCGIDAFDDESLTYHKMMLEAGVLIIENLCCLEQAGNDVFDFFALPLKYRNSDGAPVRAIGIK